MNFLKIKKIQVNDFQMAVSVVSSFVAFVILLQKPLWGVIFGVMAIIFFKFFIEWNGETLIITEQGLTTKKQK